MIAIKKSYEYTDNVLTEKQYGSLIGIEWVNVNGNTFRAFTVNPVNAGKDRRFIVDVSKEIKPIGEDKFIPYESYQLIADDYTYRSYSTGKKVDASEALDIDGNIKNGYATDVQFFINVIGYNISGIVMSLYGFLYDSIAEKEGVVFS
jgi:hypothetical protein